MGKISPVSAKYIIHANIEITGVVDRPDVIGAIFGQTEGLLGADLELREIQRSGRIGRIEVNLETKGGKSKGTIIVPSSLDKAETSIIAAALEIIQRIGPCNAKVGVEKIEDIRISKRIFVINRAKELLRTMIDSVMPDSQELADEVSYSVRVMECVEYGKDRLPAGPAIDESDEIVVVEGRADVLNLLKHGIKNAIALGGTTIPETILELCKRKTVTVFVDGDRGGELIVKALTEVAEIDYVCRAPDGKEVEEITKKEIHKSLRARVSAEQAKLDFTKNVTSGTDDDLRSTQPLPTQPGSSPVRQLDRQMDRQMDSRPMDSRPIDPRRTFSRPVETTVAPKRYDKVSKVTPEEKEKFKSLLEDLIGTRGAYILDTKLNILGKVPITELNTTVKSLKSGMYAIVFDGVIDKDLVMTAEQANVSHVIAMSSRIRPGSSSVNILTAEDL
jgi:DNA primase